VKRVAEVVLFVAVVAAAIWVNAKVHGIGYHWWPDRVYCQPQDHPVYWWVGRTQHVGCGESLTITVGAR
jgi:hypothetical protein